MAWITVEIDPTHGGWENLGSKPVKVTKTYFNQEVSAPGYLARLHALLDLAAEDIPEIKSGDYYSIRMCA